MDRKESILHFYTHQVKPARAKLMDDLQHTLHTRYTELTAEFLSHFRLMIQEVSDAQKRGAKGPIAYIQYSMLRTELLGGAMNVLVEAYDDSWLLDRTPIRSFYSSRWAYECLERMLNGLGEELLHYQGTVTAVELDRIMLQEAALVNRYLVHFIRRSCRALEDFEWNSLMDLEQIFEVRVGEYLDASECVFRLDRRNRSIEEIGEALEESDGLEVMYAHFQGLDMSEMECSDLDFRYSRFDRIDLHSTDFQRCILIGTRWRNCSLENTDFTGSILYGADFSGCSLERAVFREIIGEVGHPEGLAQGPEYDALNFENSNLSGADFRGAHLRGAIFRGANLTDTLWEGADVEGAIFDDAERRRGLSDTFV
ncbi:pentapeptide repeat-containing protein [Paenibacillus sp. PK1-4R]|uniref:pentapeptide repeat-containing protein n=1 Tax=Paenibacillus sp. PK1-4R TaxID=3049075 RepID=UPI0025A107EA|nr:pentapeptide repeat-containing protein [Paenibacillus sp. PK1-4R]WJM06852.1 pentapeptide repeat-containing protein [Paenibacillus sp. PK1-4R]